MVKLADRRGKARERKGKEEAKEDKKIGRKTLKLFLACSEMSKKKLNFSAFLWQAPIIFLLIHTGLCPNFVL